MYSRGEFIHLVLSLLEALTALGEADERDKGDDGHDDDKQIKHGIPPQGVRYYEQGRCLPTRTAPPTLHSLSLPGARS